MSKRIILLGMVCWGLAFAIWSSWQKTGAYRLHKGVRKYEAGDFDGAIADYDRAIALNPHDSRAYYDRGLAKQAKGDLCNSGIIEES
jgi:tetratricopeptide (TPR) repeat protein